MRLTLSQTMFNRGVFMDFHSRRREDEKIEVNPYPFNEKEISLFLAYYEFNLPKQARDQIVGTLRGDKPEEGQRLLRNIIVESTRLYGLSKEKGDFMQSALEAYQQFAGDDFFPNPMQEELFDLIAPERDKSCTSTQSTYREWENGSCSYSES